MLCHNYISYDCQAPCFVKKQSKLRKKCINLTKMLGRVMKSLVKHYFYISRTNSTKAAPAYSLPEFGMQSSVQQTYTNCKSVQGLMSCGAIFGLGGSRPVNMIKVIYSNNSLQILKPKLYSEINLLNLILFLQITLIIFVVQFVIQSHYTGCR